jgi:L-threonylcarbamoyladenylate synthase
VEQEPSTSDDLVTERLAPDDLGIRQAAALLGRGGLVAFPTETVYGLGADGRDATAIARLYAAKERPRFNPLISHVADIVAARRRGRFDACAEQLAAAFWPGPLTLVLPVTPDCDVSDLARAGLESVAIRVPAHPIGHRLLAEAGFPVVAPSANRSGRVSPTEAVHVLGDLDGRIDAIIQGGPTQVGVESTIVACLGGAPTLLRPGGVAREAIEAVLGAKLAQPAARSAAAPLAPGALASHYAPRALVRLNARYIRPGEAALLFGNRDMPGADQAAAIVNLSRNGDLAEAAANLFAAMRQLDLSSAATIAVAVIPPHGLGEAVNDRLSRAAAER